MPSMKTIICKRVEKMLIVVKQKEKNVKINVAIKKVSFVEQNVLKVLPIGSKLCMSPCRTRSNWLIRRAKHIQQIHIRMEFCCVVAAEFPFWFLILTSPPFFLPSLFTDFFQIVNFEKVFYIIFVSFSVSPFTYFLEGFGIHAVIFNFLQSGCLWEEWLWAGNCWYIFYLDFKAIIHLT